MHTFKRNDSVTVFGRTIGGRFVIEGEAKIIRPIKDVDEYYVVAFADGRYQRFVDPAGQSDPAAYLARLNDLIGAAIAKATGAP